MVANRWSVAHINALARGLALVLGALGALALTVAQAVC